VHLGGRALLLAGGVVQEVASTVDLLARPRSVAGQEFSKSGTCAVPSPDTDPAYLDEAFVDRYKPAVAKVAPVPEIIPFGPRGFRWVDRNRLAATPRPGLMGDQELDLKALAKVGVDRLVSLEESETVPRMPAWRLGIKIRHLPIPDMQTPTFEEARRLVEEIDGWLAEGKRVAVHCKAGLGRTGTMLASYYVFKGLSPTEAIRKLRCVDPRMVQSEIQERFVEDFHQRLVDAGVKAESF